MSLSREFTTLSPRKLFMPNSSLNSPSVLTVTEQNQQSFVEESSVIIQPYITKGNDWFYGTEELLDALPKLWTRSMLYLLVSFAAIVLPWLILAKVDETANATGRIEPKGATQKLDSAVTSTVTAVNVQEGTNVRSGQVLVQLDSNILRADLQQAQRKLEGLINQQSQLELLKNQLLLAINIQEQQNRYQELEKLSQVNQARDILETKKNTYSLQKLTNQSQVAQTKQNIDSTLDAQRLANSRWQRDLVEVARYDQLQQQGVVPQTKVIELQRTAEESYKFEEEAKANIIQARLHFQEELSRYKSTISQAQSDIEQARLQLQEQQSSYQSLVQSGKLAVLKNQEQLKDLQQQIGSLQSEIAQTCSQITSLKLQLEQRIVRSPIDGVIYDLPIKKPGSVVQTGDMIAQIAPKNTPLILKAQISSQQSGFVKVGMPVKIKLDAYPFQEYGVRQGRITWISPDSKIRDNNPNRTETYEMDIALDQPYIQTANKRINLTPGQTGTVEVIIRQRRIIDFILDPFKKLEKEGLNL